MSRTISPSSGQPYGLALVCRAWGAPRATIYRHRAPPRTEPPRRRGPAGPMPDPALLAAIRAILAGSPFHGEGHRKVWSRLRLAGVRTSKRRVLRLMRKHDLLAPSRVGSPRGPRSSSPSTIAQPGASASMPHRAPPASRRSNRSVRACASISAASPRTSPAASPSGTITDRNTCPTPFRRNSNSSAPRAHPPSSVRRKAMAAPNDSSAH